MTKRKTRAKKNPPPATTFPTTGGSDPQRGLTIGPIIWHGSWNRTTTPALRLRALADTLDAREREFNAKIEEALKNLEKLVAPPPEKEKA